MRQPLQLYKLVAMFAMPAPSPQAPLVVDACMVDAQATGLSSDHTTVLCRSLPAPEGARQVTHAVRDLGLPPISGARRMHHIRILSRSPSRHSRIVSCTSVKAYLQLAIGVFQRDGSSRSSCASEWKGYTMERSKREAHGP